MEFTVSQDGLVPLFYNLKPAIPKVFSDAELRVLAKLQSAR